MFAFRDSCAAYSALKTMHMGAQVVYYKIVRKTGCTGLFKLCWYTVAPYPVAHHFGFVEHSRNSEYFPSRFEAPLSMVSFLCISPRRAETMPESSMAEDST